MESFSNLWARLPLVRVAIPFVAGMLVAQVMTSMYIFSSLWLTLLCCGFCLIFIGFTLPVRPEKAGGRNSLAGISLLLLAFVLGFARYTFGYNQAKQAVPKDNTFVSGSLTTNPQEKARTWALTLRLDNGSQLMVYADKKGWPTESAWTTGDRVKVWVSKPRPTCPTLPDPNDKEGQFTFFRSYLFFNGVTATCFTPSECCMADSSRQEHSLWQEQMETLRQEIHWQYFETLDKETASMVEAMTMGEKSGIDRQVKAAFSEAGISHLLALSGFHLGILLTILNLLLMRSWLPLSWRRRMIIIVVPVVWIYTLLVGAPPSLVRAAIMCTLLQLSMALGWTNQLPQSLAAAAIVMLAVKPLMLMQVGFQLSFASMLGISCMGLPLLEWWQEHSKEWAWHRRLWRWHCAGILGAIVSVTVITVAASLFTMPIVAYHFGRVPLFAVLSNLGASALSVMLMWGVVIWWLCHLWSPILPFASIGLGWVANALTDWAQWVASLPFASVETRITEWQLIPIYTGMLSLLSYPRIRGSAPLFIFLISLIAFALLRLYGI